MKHTLLLAGLLTSCIAPAQYCTSGGPSSTVDSNVQLVRLLGQGDSIRHIGCPGVTGVQNLTNLSTTLNATGAYTLQVQFGTCNGNYLGSGEAWIDYDQSQTFDSWESVGTWTGTPPVALSVYNFSVPANAHNGATRMRVMQREGNITPPLDPCGAFTWGSVMDFTIVITGGLDCSAYTGDDVNDPIIVGSLPYTHNGDNSFCYTNRNPVYPSPDVFYRVIPSAQAASIRATLCGSSFDTFLSVIDADGNVLAYNDDASGCAPQSELTFSAAGVDTAYVIVEGWGMQSGTYTLQLTEDFVGIDEPVAQSVRLFPNPAGSSFVLSGNVSGAVTITDVTGKTVDRFTDYNGQPVSVEGYAPGVYFVQFTIGGRRYSEKLIVRE